MSYSTKAAELLDVLTKTAYPEPRSDLHRSIIDKVWAEIVRPCLEPGASILDIGCGEGYALGLFKEAGFDATGLSINAENVDDCHAKGLSCLRMDMHDLDDLLLLGNKFDLVWIRHCLEHSPFPLLALAEARRVLKPGGWLYVEVPAPDTVCRHEENKNHFSVHTQRAWRALLVKAGFEVPREDTLDFQTAAGPDRYFAFLCRRPE